MNVVDSSGWLEYFAGTPRAGLFAKAIENTEQLVVPVITIYEVFKKVLRERGENLALRAASQMQLGQVVEIDVSLALSAGRHDLPLADSLIYATAQLHKATLWTQDAHFEGLPGVRYLGK
ncbi:MAG: type II toxin-antitoxin system VapC family toxin [Pseudomonadota bacterium]